MMAVLSRMIGRHKLIQPNFYAYLQRYLKPGQKETPKVLQYLAEACHTSSPIESVQKVLKYVIMNFANESCKEDRITSGLNCIKEMCTRMPLLMEEDDLNFLANLRYYKNKAVSMAAKGLINLYRDLNPYLLKKEFRGRNTIEQDEEKMYLGKKNYLYGEQGGEHLERIDGAELLQRDKNGMDIECDRIFDEKDFKKIRALKRRKMYDRELKKLEEEENEEPAMHVPELDILEYNRKRKIIKKFKEKADGMHDVDLEDLDALNEEELIELVSEGDLEEDSDEEADDEIDAEGLDSDGASELDADEEVLNPDSSDEEGYEDVDDEGSYLEIDDSDIEDEED